MLTSSGSARPTLDGTGGLPSLQSGSGVTFRLFLTQHTDSLTYGRKSHSTRFLDLTDRSKVPGHGQLFKRSPRMLSSWCMQVSACGVQV